MDWLGHLHHACPWEWPVNYKVLLNWDWEHWVLEKSIRQMTSLNLLQSAVKLLRQCHQMGYFGEQNSLHPSSLPSKLRCLPFPTCSSNIEWWGGGGKLHFSPLKSAKFSKRPFSRADCFNPGVLTNLWVIDSGKAWGLEHNYLDVLLYSNNVWQLSQ